MKKQNRFTLIKWDYNYYNRDNEYEIVMDYSTYDGDRSQHFVIGHYESYKEAEADQDYFMNCINTLNPDL